MAYQLVDAKDISIVNGAEYVLSSRVGKGDSPIVVDVKAAAGSAGTIYLESSSDGFTTVTAIKNTAIVASGTASITLVKESDAANYPLRQNIRVRIVASADSEIESIRMCLDK